MGIYDLLQACEGFMWDEGNRKKNSILHDVTCDECEEVFFNQPLLLANDHLHSQNEVRFFALGRTNSGRAMFVSFQIRGDLIRVICARNMNSKEYRKYEKVEANSKI
jgi:hypothetical protein